MAKAPQTKRRPLQPPPITWETARKFALALPGAEEGTSYGTPAFKVRGKLFLRLHQSGEALVVGIDGNDRALRIPKLSSSPTTTRHTRGSSCGSLRFRKTTSASCSRTPGGASLRKP
jgi:hypothetical protein